jgi:hypothetical protein
VREPVKEARLTGRASSVRLRGRSGRTKLDEALARLLGLLSLPSRFGTGPKDRRLIPDVDSLVTCLVEEGVSSAAADELLVVLALVRFLLLIVTLDGMKFWPKADRFRGEARGGVLTGAGSFDLADCTRCSSLCICAVRVRIWVRDVELGRPRVAGAFALAFRMTEGVAFLAREELVGAVSPLEFRKVDDDD